jgi:hypothetical protein
MYHRPPTVLLTVMQPAAQNPFEATRSNDAFDRGDARRHGPGRPAPITPPRHTHQVRCFATPTVQEIPRPVASVDDTAW